MESKYLCNFNFLDIMIEMKVSHRMIEAVNLLLMICLQKMERVMIIQVIEDLEQEEVIVNQIIVIVIKALLHFVRETK